MRFNIRSFSLSRGRDGNHAFSLVELSIVLVILGLLVGGILSGQILIHAAELRSVSTQYERYVAAVHTFRDKYFAIPGDMTNATSFWGTNGSGCPGASSLVPQTSTCDGDGNGNIKDAGSNTAESYLFWQHLANAGLIEGSYSGAAGPDTGPDGPYYDIRSGSNVPGSRLNNTLWTVRWINATASGSFFVGLYGNTLQLGGKNPMSWNDKRAIRAEDAWNIDRKSDDGKPATGRILGVSDTACTTAASPTDYAALYALTNTSNGCLLAFLLEGSIHP